MRVKEMEKAIENLLRVGAATVGTIVGLYGGWNEAMTVLVVMMVVDYIMGCACALMGKSPKTETGHFWSKVAAVGILKKGVIMLVVLVAIQLDRAISLGGGTAPTGVMFQSAATFFYIANEGMSILENAALIGVPVPQRIKRMLEVMREENDDDDDGNGEG